MKQQTFESLHQDTWSSFKAQLVEIETKRDAIKEYKDFPATYRALCHHLSIARSRQYSAYLVNKLNDLVLRGHQVLYKPRGQLIYQIYEFLVAGFPRAIRREWRFISAGVYGLFGTGLLFYILVYLYPDLIYNIMSPSSVSQMEIMYDPSNGKLGRERQSDTDLFMFGFYIKNNIGIAFQTFASGIVFCLGSLFYLIYNGIVLGAVFAHMHTLGYQETFFTFVIGHGSFELIAIAFAGGAGIKIGWSLVSPGRYSRKKSLRVAAKESVPIVYGAFLMLVIAAFVEAFWSSSSNLPDMVKYAVGGLFWLLHIVYFVFGGRVGSQ